jgi:hypothetical protein
MVSASLGKKNRFDFIPELLAQFRISFVRLAEVAPYRYADRSTAVPNSARLLARDQVQ